VGTPIAHIDWDRLVPPDQWAVYRSVLDSAIASELPFALGGGLAVGLYTGRPRNTKDLDIYVRPQDRDRMIGILTASGLDDYFDKKPYDRQWIYRGNRDDVIVDTIWSMANQRASVDECWLTRGPAIRMFDREFRAVPPEELIWSKLYVLQRDRCDWPDILNLICATGAHLDWAHLFDRVAEDRPLLKSVLAIFSWLSPQQAISIPKRVWESLDLPFPNLAGDPDGRPARPDLLDTRPWFCSELPLRELTPA
jgi:hypothetical protein